MLSRYFLEDIRRKALRGGIWFTAIDRIERGMLDLTIRTVEVVRSRTLGVVIVKILVKLKKALKSWFVKRMERLGLNKVIKITSQAVEWGYDAAKNWILDLGFAQYLTMIEVNRPTGFDM